MISFVLCVIFYYKYEYTTQYPQQVKFYGSANSENYIETVV